MTGTWANALWETAPRAQIEATSTARAIQVIGEAYQRVPFYRWFYDRAGLRPGRLRTLADVRREVPFVTKADLLEFQGTAGWPGLDQAGVRQFHLTSGTSGAGREFHVRDQSDLAALGTGGAYSLLWAGLRPGERLLLTIPYSQTMAGPYFQAACEAAAVVPVNGFALDSAARIDALRTYRCAAISLTPSHLHRLTVLTRQRGVEPARDLPDLRSIILSGESYGLQWAERMQAWWGARVYEGWGATQTMSVAMATCPLGAVVSDPAGVRRGTLHGLDHRCLVEVLGPGDEPAEPGQYGELVVTTLRVSAMPCIRFRMGDQVRRHPREHCDCGRPFSTYEAGSISRIDDMMKVRGMNIWPAAVDSAVFGVPSVTDYRGRLFTDDDGREQMLLEIETPADGPADEPAGEALEHLLATRVKTVAGITPLVRVLSAGAIGEPMLNTTGSFKARRWTDQRLAQLDGGADE
jgi:phenylacetate-CoA ligase